MNVDGVVEILESRKDIKDIVLNYLSGNERCQTLYENIKMKMDTRHESLKMAESSKRAGPSKYFTIKGLKATKAVKAAPETTSVQPVSDRYGTIVVNTTVGFIRPRYHDLGHWVQNPNNISIVRGGYVFVERLDRKFRFPKNDSIWANPFKLDKSDQESRTKAISSYRDYITKRLDKDPELVKELLKLKGKRLGCTCKPLACHGDVLVELISKYDTLSNGKESENTDSTTESIGKCIIVEKVKDFITSQDSLVYCIPCDLVVGQYSKKTKDTVACFENRNGDILQLKPKRKAIGEVTILEDDSISPKRYIFYMMTRNNIEEIPTCEDFEKACKRLAIECKILNIKRLSIPKIEDTFDELDWNVARSIIESSFRDVDITITIYKI